MTRKEKARQQWMAQFEEYVVQIYPQARGKIDWDTAAHFFNQGLRPVDAGTVYVKRRIEQGGTP